MLEVKYYEVKNSFRFSKMFKLGQDSIDLVSFTPKKNLNKDIDVKIWHYNV